MNIREIHLSNWCQYEGNHVFDLNSSPDKNVVLVHADNDIGKSSLFYSIGWCFHEQQPEKWLKNDWPLYPLPWFNKAATGNEIKTSVEIVFEHKEVKYSATRSFITQKTTNVAVEVDSQFKLQREEAGGNWITEDKDKLHRILPKSVLGYFIFDAEKVEHFVNQSENVQHSVKRLLDIEDAERAVEHLQKVASELNRELSRNKGTSDKASALQTQIINVNKAIEDLENNLDKYKSELVTTKDKRKLVEEQLFKFKDAHELLEEEKKIESNISTNTNDKINLLKKIRKITTSIHTALAYTASKETFAFLEDKRIKGELPKNIKSTFVDERIRISKCICGTQLITGQDPYKTICAFRDTLSDQLSDISQELNNGLVSILTFVKNQKTQLLSLMENLSLIKRRANSLKLELKDVRGKIQARKDLPDVPGLQIEKERLENEENTLLRRIPGVESDLLAKKKFLEQLNALLKAEFKTKANSDNLEKKWLLATSAQSAMTRAIESFKTKARSYLEEQCNIIGKELFWREDVYTIHINDDYLIKVTSPEYGDKNLLAGMSMGVTHITGLTLIAALARQTQAQAPLIMDTPFARLGPAHITRALSECPKHFQQWILFLQPAEWKDTEYRQILGSKIQKEFTLTRDNSTGITIAKEGYHKEYFGKIVTR